MANFILSSLEFVSVFLLAVEAIKLENLGWIKAKSIKLVDFLNPRIEFVENYTPPESFIGKHLGQIMIFAMFITGLFFCSTIFFYLMKVIGIPVVYSRLVPQTAPGWAMAFFMMLFMPVIGLIIYTMFLKLLSGVITVLSWIERSTKSGVVGLLGFTLYAIQFFAK